jgi:hypothetical protein
MRWPERTAISLARIVAGPERREWLDAIEAELSILPSRRLDWALGSLVAAVKDRAVRDRHALALFAVVPACAAVAVLPVTALAAAAFGATGLSNDLLGPILLPIPFLFAMLFGAARRWRRPAVVGALGFAIYQAGPSAFFHFAWGNSFGFWAPNLAQYGIHPAVSVAGTLALWCLGTALGARIGERRRRRARPDVR